MGTLIVDHARDIVDTCGLVYNREEVRWPRPVAGDRARSTSRRPGQSDATRAAALAPVEAILDLRVLSAEQIGAEGLVERCVARFATRFACASPPPSRRAAAGISGTP